MTRNLQISEQYHRIGQQGRRYWGKQAAGIFAVVGDEVLLLKRSDDGDHGGTWSAPGGKIERGETDLDAAWREAREEAGLERQGSRVEDFERRDGNHRFRMFLYRFDKKPPIRLSSEHTDWRWFKLNDLQKENLHPRLREALPAYLNALRHNAVGNKSIAGDSLAFAEWLKKSP